VAYAVVRVGVGASSAAALPHLIFSTASIGNNSLSQFVQS